MHWSKETLEMVGWLLPVLIILPLIGAVACALASSANAKRIAFAVSLLTAVIAIVILLGFDFHMDLATVELVEKRLASTVQIDFKPASDSPFQVESIGFSPHLGVDMISMWLVLLTALLTPLAIAASFD